MQPDSRYSAFPRTDPITAPTQPRRSSRPDWVPDELFPFESRFVDLDGCRLHYVDEGDGPTLLMLPGSPMWSFMYRSLIERLAPRFRCVAADLPGLGLSSARLFPGGGFAAAAEWLERFIEEIGIDDFILVAHATAGPPGLEAAVRRHRSVRGLVISNTFGWPLDDSPRLRTFVRLVSSRPFGWANVGLNLLPRVTARFGRRGGRFDPREARAILGPYRERAVREHFQNYLNGVRLERPMFATLERRLSIFARSPALLLYGRHDNGYAAGFLERWKRPLRRHSAVVLEGCGHFPLEDDPEGFGAALEGWLREFPD